MDFHDYKKLLHKLESLEAEARKRAKKRGSDRQSKGPRLASIRSRRKRGRPEGAARDGFTT